MTDSSKTPPSKSDDTASHVFFSACCEPSALIGDHWLEMTATLPLNRSEDFAAWMDRQLALAENELAEFATPRSSASHR